MKVMITIIENDCLSAMQDLSAESIDLIVTDPPYGIDYKSNRQQLDRKASLAGQGEVKVREPYFTKIANDGSVPVEWLTEAHRVLKEGSAIYIFCHWSRWHELTTRQG